MVDLNTQVAHWLEEWTKTREHVSPHRRQADQTRIAKYVLPTFARRSVTRLTAEQVEQWRSDLEDEGVGTDTIYATVMILRQTVDLAYESMGLTKPNPVAGVASRTAVREAIPAEIFTDEQFEAIVKNTDPLYQAMILFLGCTGARWNETIGLRTVDLHLKDGHVEVGKIVASEYLGKFDEKPGPRGSIRRLPLSDPLRLSLLDYLAETATWRTRAWNWVFLTKRDHKHPLQPNFTVHVWRPALRAAGLDDRTTTMHNLRHTAAVRMINNGESIEDVSKALGHQSVNTTKKMYRQFLLERAKENATT